MTINNVYRQTSILALYVRFNNKVAIMWSNVSVFLYATSIPSSLHFFSTLRGIMVVGNQDKLVFISHLLKT